MPAAWGDLAGLSDAGVAEFVEPEQDSDQASD